MRNLPTKLWVIWQTGCPSWLWWVVVVIAAIVAAIYCEAARG